jgi:hypothetical protein
MRRDLTPIELLIFMAVSLLTYPAACALAGQFERALNTLAFITFESLTTVGVDLV